MKKSICLFALVLAFLSGTAQDTAGTYIPTVTAKSFNVGLVSTVQTRFIQSDSEVIVSGMFAVNSFNNAGQTCSITLSLPIPGTPTLVYGSLQAYQALLPVVGVVQSAGNTYTMRWVPTNTSQSNIYFSFTYTNQP
jgi:hypothetical protein